MYSANTTIKYICIIAKFEVYINYIFHKIKPQISLIMTISKKPLLAATRNGFHIDSLAGCSGRYTTYQNSSISFLERPGKGRIFYTHFCAMSHAFMKGMILWQQQKNSHPVPGVVWLSVTTSRFWTNRENQLLTTKPESLNKNAYMNHLPVMTHPRAGEKPLNWLPPNFKPTGKVVEIKFQTLL